ncbi:glycosyltransferase family 2 protein [Peribacillus sp. NPDC006672]|uniref:glycosyltransferase family 2 protein n=1 Tax=Peribacillus sp. NPDC006672 TaxID=3390606 RepID=UPI003D06A2A6
MTISPLVSVIMATFNANPEHLKDSIKSILSQTYKNIEFIIINDGSTTINPKKIIDNFKDERILYISNEKNQGLTKCLNIGLNYCNGKFIARMDDDDISFQNRIEKQVNIFEQNSNINILGTNVEYFGNSNKYSNIIMSSNIEIQQIRLLLGNKAIFHPTVMYRASFLEKNNIKYNEKYKKAQDYGMWVECTKFSNIDCLPEVLLRYRTHPNQISNKNRNEQQDYDDMIRIDQLEFLGIKPSETQIKTHLEFCKMDINLKIRDTEKWIEFLIRHNKETKKFNANVFSKIIKRYWIFICYNRFFKEKNLKYLLPLIKSLNLNIVSEFLLNKTRSIWRVK